MLGSEKVSWQYYASHVTPSNVLIENDGWFNPEGCRGKMTRQNSRCVALRCGYAALHDAKRTGVTLFFNAHLLGEEMINETRRAYQ